MNFSVIIKETSKGKGLFASDALTIGSAIILLNGKTTSFPSKYSVQLNHHLHIEPDLSDMKASSWRFINHSCQANSFVDVITKAIVAAKNIAAGEEITLNYLTTEREMLSPFQCLCRSSGCFGTIRGYKFLEEAAKEKLEIYAAPYLRRTEKEQDKIFIN